MCNCDCTCTSRYYFYYHYYYYYNDYCCKDCFCGCCNDHLVYQYEVHYYLYYHVHCSPTISVTGVRWLAEQLLEAPELLIGSTAEFASFAATLVQKHARKTASIGDTFWSAHREGRHKFLSGGARHSINASIFTPE